MECRYNTDEYADAKAALERKLQLLGLHERAEHTLDPVLSLSVQPATQRRKPKKFPRPTVGLEETREGLDNFRLNWTQCRKIQTSGGQMLTGSWWHVAPKSSMQSSAETWGPSIM